MVGSTQDDVSTYFDDSAEDSAEDSTEDALPVLYPAVKKANGVIYDCGCPLKRKDGKGVVLNHVNMTQGKVKVTQGGGFADRIQRHLLMVLAMAERKFGHVCTNQAIFCKKRAQKRWPKRRPPASSIACSTMAIRSPRWRTSTSSHVCDTVFNRIVKLESPHTQPAHGSG